MPTSLRDALAETYSDWQSEFPSAWSSIIDGASVGTHDVDESLELEPWVPIFPTLNVESRVLGAPRGAHVFRAFRSIRPRDVRAVIIGQDPYPDIAKATGLSFEQGNLREWSKDAHLVSKSLRRIIQSAAATETGEDAYLRTSGWSRFLRDVRSGDVEPRSPKAFFNESRDQGVLWLNTTLSISLFRGDGRLDHQPGHRAFWAPIVDQVLHHLAGRDAPSVFVLWGQWARDLREGLEAIARSAGTADTIGFTEVGHPVTNGFLKANPLADINDELERLGLDPIDWL
jgi:uracil-DNA glycosylase